MIVQFTILHKKITVVNRFSRIGNFFLHFFRSAPNGRREGDFPPKRNTRRR